MIQLILFLLFIFLAAGMYLIFCSAVKMPSLATTKANLHITQKHKAKSIDALSLRLANTLSKYIKLSDYKKQTLTATLRSAGIALTPETYIAFAIVSGALKLLIAVPAYFLSPALVPLIIIWAIWSCIENLKEAEKKVADKREKIDIELPRFVATVSQELKASRDVLAIIEGYKTSAGKEFKSELEILIADMKSGSPQKALTRFETRIGSSKLSEVVRGLQAVLHGDNGVNYFEMLAHDFKQMEIQRLRLLTMKRPDKVRVHAFLVLACFVVTLFIIMGIYAYNKAKMLV